MVVRGQGRRYSPMIWLSLVCEAETKSVNHRYCEQETCGFPNCDFHRCSCLSSRHQAGPILYSCFIFTLMLAFPSWGGFPPVPSDTGFDDLPHIDWDFSSFAKVGKTVQVELLQWLLLPSNPRRWTFSGFSLSPLWEPRGVPGRETCKKLEYHPPSLSPRASHSYRPTIC